jgi:hypothetical protein
MMLVVGVSESGAIWIRGILDCYHSTAILAGIVNIRFHSEWNAIHTCSARKPPDPLLQFLPGRRHHRVGPVPMPELVALPTPVPHQIEVIEFFAQMMIRVRAVMNVERSLL